MKENILVFAYNMERDSSELYAKMAQESKDNFIQMIFKDLSEEEFKHQEMIMKIIKKQETRNTIPEIPDLKISDILEKPVLRPGMSPREIITYVIKMEEEAKLLYEALYHAASDPGDKETYKSLMKMEASHKYRFERVLQDIDSWQR